MTSTGPIAELQEESRNASQAASQNLQKLKASQLLLLDRSEHPVTLSPPIMVLPGNEGVMWPNTLVVVKGKTGEHKSRLVELFATVFLAKEQPNCDTLGFTRQLEETCLVCYVDTERNEKEHFPFVIQQIKKRAGYTIKERLPNFQPLSIKCIPRPERIAAPIGIPSCLCIAVSMYGCT